MKNVAAAQQTIRFDRFELDAGELRKDGVRIRLQEQPLRILELLLATPGQLVTRDELRRELWPGNTLVDFDHGLNRAMNKLREALDDSSESPRFIDTIAKRLRKQGSELEAAEAGAEHDDSRLHPIFSR